MFLRFIFTLLVILLSNNLAASEKTKALWIVRYALKDKNEVSSILQYARRLEITDLYVQVRAAGRFFFNSENNLRHLGQNTAAVNFKKLCRQAELHNIKVHAWINVLNIWSSSNSPPDNHHVFNSSPMSVLRCWDETKTDYSRLKNLGIEGYFIDPDDQKNFDNLKVLIKLLINEYSVDGIHLDYFRLPAPEVTASPSLRSSFVLEQYIDPLNVFNKARADTDIRVPAETVYSMYFEFLKNRLTNLLANIQLYIKSINPGIILSIAVKPSPAAARSYYFQDWPKWLETGLCDYAAIMNYVPETFDKYLAECTNLGLDDQIVVGIASYNQGEHAVISKITKVRQSNFKGYALFSYNSLKEKNMLKGY